MGKSFHELRVWQLAMDLLERVYLACESFPRSEVYGLTSQMRRAAVSIPSNIAEGQDRHSQKEFLRFISNARGSLAELETQILLAQRLRYLTEQIKSELVAMCDEVGRLLNRLNTAIEERVRVSQLGTGNRELGTR